MVRTISKTCHSYKIERKTFFENYSENVPLDSTSFLVHVGDKYLGPMIWNWQRTKEVVSM